MEPSSKIPYFLCLLTILACQPEQAEPHQELLVNEGAPCLGLWRYEQVSINGTAFVLATDDMLPGNAKSAMGGNRAELERRRRYYGENGYYQLRWVDRGEYQLGRPGESDWQPSVGSWHWQIDNDTLIHHKNQYYQVKYYLQVIGNRMTLTSLRVMAQGDQYSGQNLWRKGDTVVYEEVFLRVEQ